MSEFNREPKQRDPGLLRNVSDDGSLPHGLLSNGRKNSAYAPRTSSGTNGHQVRAPGSGHQQQGLLESHEPRAATTPAAAAGAPVSAVVPAPDTVPEAGGGPSPLGHYSDAAPDRQRVGAGNAVQDLRSQPTGGSTTAYSPLSASHGRTRRPGATERTTPVPGQASAAPGLFGIWGTRLQTADTLQTADNLQTADTLQTADNLQTADDLQTAGSGPLGRPQTHAAARVATPVATASQPSAALQRDPASTGMQPVATDVPEALLAASQGPPGSLLPQEPVPPAASHASALASPAGPAATAKTGVAPGNSAGAAAPSRGDGEAAAPAVSAGAMTPKTPAADPAFQAVKSRAQLAAKVNKIHEPAHTKAAQVDDAVVSPPEETQGQANARHMDDLAQQKPAPFDKGAFKATVRQKIVDAAPKNLEQADNFKSDNKLGDVKKQAASDVKQSSEQSAGPIQKKNQETPSTSGLRQKSVKPLAPEAPSGPASNLGARGAAPKPRKEAEISLQAGPLQIQKQMADHQVTEPQLQRSNEPTFLAAVDAKQAAQKDADVGPAKFRPAEQGALAAAGAGAEAMAIHATQTMKGGRDVATRQVLSQQEMAKGKDEQARSQVAAKIQSIFDDSKQQVQNRLTKLDSDVNDAFDKGADAARKDFEDYVAKRMDAYKDDRYSGWLGPAKWVWDKLAGMPDEVNVFYEEGRDRFLLSMDGTLDLVATMVEVGLNEATALVAGGRKQVQGYVDSLPQSLHQIGQDAQSSIEDQFQSLEQSIQDKQDELVDGLAQKYTDQVKQLDDRINELKEENKGLVQKAIEFIVDVVKTLVEMGALLVKILIRAAGVVWKILKDPIGFLRNLISGAKNGFDRFTENIAKHLQRGLVQWLTGELGGAGLQLPDTLDAKGVFMLVLQVLGLSYEGIRARLVRHFGEGTAQAVEEGVDIIRKVKEGGVGALWEELKEHLGNLKDQVLGDIQQYVQTQVIQAGVMWVVSLFSPASAFVQACKAIYRIVQFFVEKAAQIAALVDAVLDSVEAVADGDVGAMASKIEGALAKAIPVMIGLLASLLGIGGIAQKVKSILHKVRAPIEKAIDAVLKKAAGLVKQAGKRTGDKGAGTDKQTASGTDPGAGTADMVDTGTDMRTKVSAKDENGSKPRSEVEVPRRLVFPHSETPISLAPAIQKQLATGPKSVVVHEGGSDPKEATRRVLTEHKDAEYDPRRGQLTLPSLHEAGLVAAQTMEQLGALVATQTGVEKVTLLYKGNKAYIKVQINPPALQEVQIGPSAKRKPDAIESTQGTAGKKPAKRKKSARPQYPTEHYPGRGDRRRLPQNHEDAPAAARRPQIGSPYAELLDGLPPIVVPSAAQMQPPDAMPPQPATHGAPQPSLEPWQTPRGGTLVNSPRGSTYRQGSPSGKFADKSRRVGGGFVNPRHDHGNMLFLWKAHTLSPPPPRGADKKWLMDPDRRYQAFDSQGNPTKVITGHREGVLGHGESAGAYWNREGHKRSREDNLKYNRQTDTYARIEDAASSAASGAHEARYLSPGPHRGSHPSYWNPDAKDFGGGHWPTYRLECGPPEAQPSQADSPADVHMDQMDDPT